MDTWTDLPALLEPQPLIHLPSACSGSELSPQPNLLSLSHPYTPEQAQPGTPLSPEGTVPLDCVKHLGMDTWGVNIG